MDWVADYRLKVAGLPVRSSVAPGEVASALPANPPEAPEALEALIAGEYQASSAIAGAELGVPHAVEAAHEAAAAGALERAVSFLRRARSLASSAPPHVRAEALCELALAEARALHPESAVRSTEDALAALEETGAGSEEIAAFLSEVAREMKSGSAPTGADFTKPSICPSEPTGLRPPTKDFVRLTWSLLPSRSISHFGQT